MKNIGPAAICCALAAAATGCAVTFICGKIRLTWPSGPMLTVMVEAVITFLVLCAASLWSDRMAAEWTPDKTGTAGPPNPDHRFKVPVVLLVACLTMTAATCAGHFHGGGGTGYLYSAYGLGAFASLIAMMGDLDEAIPPLMLAGIFLNEAAIVFLATLTV